MGTDPRPPVRMCPLRAFRRAVPVDRWLRWRKGGRGAVGEDDREVRYVPDQDQVSQAGTYLRMLLLRPGEYRDRWERRAGRESGADRYQAVARVLAGAGERLVGRAPGTELVATDMTDVARRALEGTELTPPVADAFVSEFGLTARQAQRLRDLLRGSPTVRVISGHTLPSPERYQAAPLRHETLSLHELHVLGPDGRPAEHETVEVIRAGRVGENPYRVNDSIYGVDIVLHRPLKAGETALMQYRSTFFYKSEPPPEFRRGI